MDKPPSPIAPTIVDSHRPSTAPTPPSDTTSLGARYEVLREIGSGGMGRVFQARDRETGEVLALKVLRPEVAAEPSMAERFKNELRLARRITHKNVCRIYDFNRVDALAYISMEYVDGETLRAQLDRGGAMSASRVVSLARQICTGLAEAHAQGVIHRDLKPENIMIAASGAVKLMDFGIARSLHAGATTTQTLIGTPAYMSPEQVQGHRVDARSDIYALGLILYECLTGRRAFSAPTPVAVALKQIQDRPIAPHSIRADIPRALETAVLRCIEKDPARRFSSVERVATALIGAHESGAIPSAPSRRWPWVLAALALAVIAVVWRQQPHPPTAPLPPQARPTPVVTPPSAPAPAVATTDAVAQVPVAARNERPIPAANEHEQPRAAFEKLREAAQAGDATAQFRLAQTLFKGSGTLRDETQARTWLQRAAEQGHTESQFALGMMFERGRGGTRDLRAARSWYERAAATGHDGAKKNLARLTEQAPARYRGAR